MKIYKLLKHSDLIEIEGIRGQDIVAVYIKGRKKNVRESAEEWIFLKKYTREEGERLFDWFLHTGLSVDDQKRLDMTWNRQFNGFAKLNYKRIPIGLETCALFKGLPLVFMEAQREAIAFIDAVGSGCLAYDVGVGKTLAAIIILAQNMQNGTFKRPLLVVPKPTYHKWIQEIVGYTDKDGKFVEGILSHLGIKINAFGNMGADIKKFKGKINSQVAEGSITLITYQGFEKLGFSQRLEDELFDDLTRILLFVDDEETAREKQQKLEDIRAMLGRAAKDTIVDVDVWGIDSIIIDEAHNCRNIFEYVPAKDNVKRFNIEGGTSKLGRKAFLICNYIQRRYGGNVVLLTATPFNNSPLEVYAMLSLIALNKMQKVGVDSIMQFMETFILETIETVVSSTNKLEQKPVVKSYQNKRALQALVFNYINFKTGEDAGVRRPVKINMPRLAYRDSDGVLHHLEPKDQLTTYLKMNAMQEAFQQEAVSWAESGTHFKDRGVKVLQAMTMSRKNAFSPFLVSEEPPLDYLDFVENSPKILYTVKCIESVKKYHESRKQPLSGQVIYSNIGVDFFPMIKEYLEKELGFKKGIKNERSKFDEVEIIAGKHNAGDRKEAVKEAFLNGTVKVIIGSQTIREGIDLQKNGAVIYNLYTDFNPTDVRQLEGRIWRQGNKRGYVRIVMPLIQDSLDVFIFQKLEEKTARINDVWSKADESNVLDQESLNPEAVKFALFTDINKLVYLRLDQMRLDIGKSTQKLERELAALNEIEVAANLLRVSKKFCIEQVEGFKKYAQDFIATHEKTEDKDKRKEVKRRIEALEKINGFDGENDRLLIDVCRKIQSFELFTHTFRQNNNPYGEDMLSIFRANLTKINKSETILSRYSNVEEAIKAIEQLLAEQQEKLKTLLQPEVIKQIYADIVKEKEKLNIHGRQPAEAVKDFEKLNYLLDYTMADVDGIRGNPLPTEKPTKTFLLPAASSPTPDKTKLKFKANALQLRRKRALALLKLAA